MKYGESAFDIFYLLFALISGAVLLKRRRNRAETLMGAAVLILGFGDAFHLVPRVLNYFVEADFTAALGIGKLVTSITMTIFYVLMFYLWREISGSEERKGLTIAVWMLFAVRIILCLFPQNAWLTNESSVTWGIIRNIPFVALGILIIALYFSKRKAVKALRFAWLLVLLSFLFYIPVAVAAGIVPILGMLMLPKTVCYMLLIVCFLRFRKDEKPE